MSFHHSPRIITDRLVLCLDAANRKSYPGTGTDWNDLTNNYNGTFLNTPTFSNNNFTFANNNYVRFPANIYTQDNSVFSFSLWFRATAPGVILHQTTANNNGSNSGWVPAVYITSSNKIRVTGFWGVGVGGGYSDPNDILYGKWYNITHTFDSSNNRRTYVDGTLVSTINGAQITYSSNYFLILGSGYAGSWPGDPGPNITVGLTGQLNSFFFYRKPLSDGEVLQNYNALKGRFML